MEAPQDEQALRLKLAQETEALAADLKNVKEESDEGEESEDEDYDDDYDSEDEEGEAEADGGGGEDDDQYLERTEEEEKQLQESLKTYAAVLCISTIVNLHRGWKIAGTVGKDMATQVGRRLGVIGEFKSGKTWFLALLLGLALVPDKTIPTLGLSVALPTAQATETRSRRERVRPLQKDKNKGPIEQREYVVLDTEGNEMATADRKLDDVRAREHFLRELTLNVASSIIFVTAKYRRSTQTTIKSVIQALGSTIDYRNRLNVVHNLMHVDNQVELDRAIDELYRVYEDSISETKLNNGISVHDSEKTRHWFLANQNTEFGKKLNEETLEQMRTQLLGQIKGDSINILDKVCAFANAKLPNYVRGFADRYEMRVVGDHIRPVDKRTGERCENTRFPLKKLMFIEGGSVIAEDEFQLTGEVRDKQSEYQVVVEMPGFCEADLNTERLQIQIRRDLRLVIKAHRPPEECAYEVVSMSARKYGPCIWEWEAHPDNPFKKPRREDISLVNGVLTMSLKKKGAIVTVGASKSK